MKQRGADVLTTQEADMGSSSDDAQVAFATGQQRVLLTHNKRDFILIHQRYLGKGKDHWGIVVADHDRVGYLLRRLSKLWFTVPVEEMKNRLEFLGRWK